MVIKKHNGKNKEIRIRCKGTKYLDLDKFLNFQGNLKELKKEEYQKLWKSMEAKGFRFPIFFGWIGKHKFYGGGEFKTSVWEVNKPIKSNLHPTTKPVKIIENALLNSSVIGQICLDPFLGSGSTLIACEKTGRICYGMEIEPHYCDVIVERYKQFCIKNQIKTEIKRNGKSIWKNPS